VGWGHGRDTDRKRGQAVGPLRGQSAREEEFIREERRERKDSRLDKMPRPRLRHPWHPRRETAPSVTPPSTGCLVLLYFSL